LKTDDQTLFDAEWILRFFGTTHLVAKADRTQNWTGQQQQVVAIDDVKIFIDER
jgi:hypothetical protein